MAISRLDRCPKCKGRLLLEKDHYGLYQQCLQCGYLHDIKIFALNDKQEIEEEKKSVAPHRLATRRSHDRTQKKPRLFESTTSTALTTPLDFHLILDALRKRQQDNAQ